MPHQQSAVIAESAVASISDQQRRFDEFYDRCVEDYPDIVKFLDRCLDWYADTRGKRSSLYTIGKDAFYDEPDRFLGRLRSFSENCFLDDSCFVVFWERHFNENGEVTDSHGNSLRIPSTEDDPYSYPRVEWSGDNGETDPNVLLHVMDVQERKSHKRESEYAKYASLMSIFVNQKN